MLVPASSRLAEPGVLAAHARLAAIDPAVPDERLLERLLEALLLGAGARKGLAIDPARPAGVAGFGGGPGPEALLSFQRWLQKHPAPDGPLPADLAAALLGEEEAPADARLIPLTANDETLALVLLPAPPVDPAAFASVAAHAASLLAVVRMRERVQKADFELKYRVWELQSLYDVGLSIAGTLDLDSLADDILLKSVSLLNARHGTLIVRDPGGEAPVLVKHFGEPLLDPESLSEIPDQVSRSNTRQDRIPALRQAPAEKLLLSPIRVEGRPLGVLVVADKENRAGGIDDFTPGDERIISLFGNQAAIALENARLHREALEKERMEREIELAAAIQKTILPASLPEVPGLLLAGGNRPTRQVGGDYYDVFPLPDGRTVLCVGDVAGKGVPAALLVSTVHACLHLLVEPGASDLPALVARVNRFLVGFSSTRKFVTLFLAVFEPGTRELRYVNAGHNPALLVSGEEPRLLRSTGLPIGMLENVVHREEILSVSPQDTLVLYTDGITEAADAAESEFGLDRLVAFVSDTRAAGPGILKDGIFEAVADFARGVPQYDDQTVLVACVR